jgi:hypothetical protein
MLDSVLSQTPSPPVGLIYLELQAMKYPRGKAARLVCNRCGHQHFQGLALFFAFDSRGDFRVAVKTLPTQGQAQLPKKGPGCQVA